MSIWCSDDEIGFTGPRGRPQGGQVRSYCDGWSSHYPTTDDTAEQRAMIHVADIAPWCVPGHSNDGSYREEAGPWLRLCLESWKHDWHNPPRVIGPTSAGVVMDEAAVRQLVTQLTDWLAKPKVYPKETP